jgi:hypothetical protein
VIDRRAFAAATLLLVAATGFTGCAARRSEPLAELRAISGAQPIATAPEAINGPWVLWFRYAFRLLLWSRHSGYATLEECQAYSEAMTAQMAVRREVGRRILASGAGLMPGVGGEVTRSVVTSSLQAQMAEALEHEMIWRM